jgi:hypothetical protein
MIEKMLELDFDHIEYTYNDLSTALHSFLLCKPRHHVSRYA